jgi:hypothetical protein
VRAIGFMKWCVWAKMSTVFIVSRHHTKRNALLSMARWNKRPKSKMNRLVFTIGLTEEVEEMISNELP